MTVVAAASPAPSSSVLVTAVLPAAAALSSAALSSAEACVAQLAASVAQAMQVRRLPHRPGRLHRV